MTSTTPLSKSPYKGLMPYTEEDAHFFFGREADREIITANLYAARLTILYGSSGVGKSSLLQAGVAYHLHQQPGRAIVVFKKWQGDPLIELRQAIIDEIVHVTQKPFPNSGNAPFHEFVTHATHELRVPLLVVLDQFEEYFLYHPGDEDGTNSFAAEFSRIVNHSDCSVNFLVSLREDSLAKLDIFERRIPFLFDNYLRLEHLDRAATREAITKPLEVYNQGLSADQHIRIEDGLVDAIIDQVQIGKMTIGRIGQGQLETRKPSESNQVRVEASLLQLILTRLWDEEMKHNSRVLSLVTLSTLGGVDQIIRTHLDVTMSQLKPMEQEVSARIFNFLVTPSGTKIALSALDLSQFVEIHQAQIQRVLKHLSEPDFRILRPVETRFTEHRETQYEIYHDVLATAVLDWRSRYLGRSPIHKPLIVMILVALGIFFFQLIMPVSQQGDVQAALFSACFRGGTLIVLNTAFLLQIYRWFYRYVSLTSRSFSIFAFGGPNAAALLGILFTIQWYVWVPWERVTGLNVENVIGNLASLSPFQFFDFLFTVMITLLFGFIAFAIMRFAGQISEHFFKNFDLGFFGAYFLICGLVFVLIVLDVLNIVPDLLPIGITSSRAN